MTYQEQQDKLLLNYLLNYEKKESSVEFIISSACNQKCEYCYLMKHGKEMYPPESNKKENILTNFHMLLEWLEKEHFEYRIYDIFSGEFFQLPFWEDILEIIFDFHETHHNLPSREIVIPSNCSFIMDDKKTKRVEYWIEKIKNSEYLGNLWISASVDGPSSLEAIERPLNSNEKKEQKFYDKFFKFLAKHEYGVHPMITKNFVKNYKQNYDFWIDNLKKYEVYFTKSNGTKVYSIPMLLEVRDNNQWDTPEALQNYHDFLMYVAEKDIEAIHNGDVEEFAQHMADDFSDEMGRLYRYCSVQPYIINLPNMYNKMPCSIQGGAVIRVGDLSIVPCHRTCYPGNVYGQFKVENDQIVGVEAFNPLLAYKIKNLNPNRSVVPCSDCEIKSFCLKGCLGSQLEHNQEMFCANKNVCDMFKVKFKTINEIAEKYNVYDYINKDLNFPIRRREYINYARRIISKQ